MHFGALLINISSILIVPRIIYIYIYKTEIFLIVEHIILELFLRFIFIQLKIHIENIKYKKQGTKRPRNRNKNRKNKILLEDGKNGTRKETVNTRA